MIRVEVIPNRSILDIDNYDEISYIASHGDLFRYFCEKIKFQFLFLILVDSIGLRQFLNWGTLQFFQMLFQYVPMPFIN